MFRHVILGVTFSLLLLGSVSGITLTDFGVVTGDSFEFHVSSAMFREYSDNSIVNDHNGFFLYSIFIEEYSPFNITVNEVGKSVSFNLEVNSTFHTIVDTNAVIIHNSDWDSYLTNLQGAQESFDIDALNGRVKGNYDIVNTDSEIGFRMNSTWLVPLTGPDYQNYSTAETVRYERSTGVILERMYHSDVVTTNANETIRDLNLYSFSRGPKTQEQVFTRIKIPGFTLIWALIPLVGLSKWIAHTRSRINLTK